MNNFDHQTTGVINNSNNQLLASLLGHAQVYIYIHMTSIMSPHAVAFNWIALGYVVVFSVRDVVDSSDVGVLHTMICNGLSSSWQIFVITETYDMAASDRLCGDIKWPGLPDAGNGRYGYSSTAFDNTYSGVPFPTKSVLTERLIANIKLWSNVSAVIQWIVSSQWKTNQSR